MQAGTRFTYPGGMEGWVDLVDLIAPRPGVEPATFRSRVQRSATAPPRQTVARQRFVKCGTRILSLMSVQLYRYSNHNKLQLIRILCKWTITHTKSMWWVEAQGWWWTNFLSRSDMPACHPWTSQWWRKELYKVLRQNRAVHGASGICSSAECAKYDCRGAERVRCVVVLDLLILTRRLLTFLSLDWKRFVQSHV